MNVYSFLPLFFLFEWAHNIAAPPRPCPQIRLQFGRIRYRQRGKIARFLCSTGYVLAGDRYSVCIQGRWDNTLPKCVRPTCKKAEPPAYGLIYPSHGGGVLNFYCKSNYQLKGSSVTFCNGTHWDNSPPTCLPTNSTAALSCNFEDEDLCGWNHDLNHDFNWKRLNYATPSGSIGTGPTFDHTKGNGSDGFYMYIESSARNPKDTARLISPIYDKSASDETLCFEFYYHMYGRTTGDLRVYLRQPNGTQTVIFSQHGNQGNRWFRGFEVLGVVDYEFQIVVEGVRGDGYVSDIAIDDVKVFRNCVPEEEQESVTTTEDSSSSHMPATVESCENRCNTRASQMADWEIPCDCDDECYDRSRCCPDYFDYCVVNTIDDFFTYSTTDTVLTTQPAKKLVTASTVPSITKLTTNRTYPTNRTTHARTKPITSTATTSTPTTPVAKQPKPEETDVNDVQNGSSDESDFQDFPDKETELINDYESDKSATHQKIIVTNKISESNTKSIVFAVGVVFGVLFAASGMAFIARRYQLFRCRKLRGLNQSSNGDSASDVRFLTSDEFLDLNLPRDYDTL